MVEIGVLVMVVVVVMVAVVEVIDVVVQMWMDQQIMVVLPQQQH